LKLYTNAIHFIGESKDLQNVAEDFEKLASTERVLFPIAKQSKRTIQKHLTKCVNVLEVVFYQTIQTPTRIDAETVVFTSPSNVESYMQLKHNRQNLKNAIAIGTTTASKLQSFGIKPTISRDFNEQSLATAVLSVLE